MSGNRACATDGPPGCSSGDPSCEPSRSSKSLAIQLSSKHVLREKANRGSRFSDGRGVARVGHIDRRAQIACSMLRCVGPTRARRLPTRSDRCGNCCARRRAPTRFNASCPEFPARLLAELLRDSLYPMIRKDAWVAGDERREAPGRGLCIWGVASGSATSHADLDNPRAVESGEESLKK